jgi:hypothetical protein
VGNRQAPASALPVSQSTHETSVDGIVNVRGGPIGRDYRCCDGDATAARASVSDGNSPNRSW